MSTVVVTGGTGLIGSALTGMLTEGGHEVVVLSRKPRPAQGPVRFEQWDVASGAYPKGLFLHTDALIHLAGENVGAGRWTAKRKEAILRSRTESSALLVRALREEPGRVRTVVCASGIGWYGPDGPGRPFVESDPSSPDFLGETCRRWEDSIRPVTELGIRLVTLRTGLVLGRGGGAFPAFREPLRAGVAAILGSGRQALSWIHLEDICRMYRFALENTTLNGVYNAAAPEIVSNKVLILTLARKLRGRFAVPLHVPAFLLRWALGEMSVEILKSCSVDVSKIRAAGFRYTFPSLEAALGELCKAASV